MPHSGKQFLISLEINMQLATQPSNHPPGHLLRETEIYVHKNVSSQMFIAALSVIAENKKQPRCFFVSGIVELCASIPWNST